MTRARRITDLLGLLILQLAIVDVFPPALLLLPTLPAGGDLVCHYPAFEWLRHELLPHGRLHGWYPGAYLGHPLFLYYFPLPFVAMAALEPFFGAPAAFKLGSALGAFLLPTATYLALRLMALPFPAPLCGAAGALVFLFVEDNPIWGGTLASTLTGEFAYAWGTALGVVFLGFAWRALREGGGLAAPSLLLGLVGLTHGYAVLWAGLSASSLLAWSKRPGRDVLRLAAIALMGFGTAAFFLVPLLADWGWTTPYNDPWLEAGWLHLLPPLLWPLLALAVVGLITTVRERDPRLAYLGGAALFGLGLAAASPALGLIDVRLLPFAQLSLAIAGSAWLGLLLSRLRRADLAALAVVLAAVAWGEGRSQVVRTWAEWNYSGLEAKDLWPQWRQLNEALSGGVGDPRVFVEYANEHERAGSVRMYETLPYLSGRSTLEGVYNQASLMTHAVYYVQSQLALRAPNPFRSRRYASQDVAAALPRLRLLNVREIVALSAPLEQALSARDDVERVARIPPYNVFALKDPGPGYVEPLRFAPVRAGTDDWRERAYRWLEREPLPGALLVFSDDAALFPLAERDPWLAPPEVPLPDGVAVESVVEPERIRIRTSRPGHPLLVKVSWHPRWKARGAHGPFRVAPALMLVIPTAPDVELRYERDARDRLGAALTLATLLLLAAWTWFERRRAAREGARSDSGSRAPERALPGRGALVPLALVLALAGMRLWPAHPVEPPGLAAELTARAEAAAGDGRCEDAREYARQAGLRSPDPALSARLQRAIACPH